MNINKEALEVVVKLLQYGEKGHTFYRYLVELPTDGIHPGVVSPYSAPSYSGGDNGTYRIVYNPTNNTLKVIHWCKSCSRWYITGDPRAHTKSYHANFKNNETITMGDNHPNTIAIKKYNDNPVLITLLKMVYPSGVGGLSGIGGGGGDYETPTGTPLTYYDPRRDPSKRSDYSTRSNTPGGSAAGVGRNDRSRRRTDSNPGITDHGDLSSQHAGGIGMYNNIPRFDIPSYTEQDNQDLGNINTVVEGQLTETVTGSRPRSHSLGEKPSLNAFEEVENYLQAGVNFYDWSNGK